MNNRYSQANGFIQMQQLIAILTLIISEPMTAGEHFCTICFKYFRDNWSLKRHIRTHTGEKPYHCEVCGRKFSRNDYLAKHRIRHYKLPYETVWSLINVQLVLLMNVKRICDWISLQRFKMCFIWLIFFSKRNFKSQTFGDVLI